MKLIILLFLLAGCKTIDPYVGYSHLSNPRIDGDASDLVCAGVKVKQGLDFSASWCENLRNDWSGVNIDVEWVWDD